MDNETPARELLKSLQDAYDALRHSGAACLEVAKARAKLATTIIDVATAIEEHTGDNRFFVNKPGAEDNEQ